MKNYLSDRKISLITSLFFALFILFSANQVFALSLSPVRFELQGDPGQSVSGEIILTNETDYPQTFYSSFSNFEAQGESGNPAFVVPKNDLGTWISTSDIVNLEPHVTKNVPFTIDIPKDAEPGGHFAVIFFGDTPVNNTGGGAVSVGSQTGALVLLSVSGDVKQAGGMTAFNLKNNKHFYNTLPVDFEYKFKNDGGDRIKPDGLITVRNIIFYPKVKLDANPSEGNILPGSTRKFEISWINYSRPKDFTPSSNVFTRYIEMVKYQWQNFAFGPYFAKIHLSYAGLNFGDGSTLFFFVFPWQLLILIAFVLGGLYVIGKKVLIRYNAHIIEKAKQNMKL